MPNFHRKYKPENNKTRANYYNRMAGNNETSFGKAHIENNDKRFPHPYTCGYLNMANVETNLQGKIIIHLINQKCVPSFIAKLLFWFSLV